MHYKEPVTVLIAPLDWGLGHATRCIPIIRELISQGVRVIIASAGPQKLLLNAEFPHIEMLDLPGYGMRYQKGIFLKWGLIFRIPSILNQIKRENQWLRDIVHARKLDAVISDNRYGLYHRDLYCVFITHQLAIQTGFGPFFDRFILKWNYRLIRKFSICWVPDWPGVVSLAGKLSHPVKQPPVAIKYIGILSRLNTLHELGEKNKLFVMLSGPEPQRTDFEKCILSQLENLSIQCILVRGLPGSESPGSPNPDGLQIISHLKAEELNVLMNASDLILARSGYSSIMDLVQLGKNAILIPTPGQTEQEYLGHHLQKMNWMLTIPQKNFNLEKAIIKFQASKFSAPPIQQSGLGKAIAELINNCNHLKRSDLSPQP